MQATEKENNSLRDGWRKVGGVSSQKKVSLFVKDKKIRATQATVFEKAVNKKLRDKDFSGIEITKFKNLLYIEDGHHALAALKKYGGKSTKVLMNDLGAALEKLKSVKEFNPIDSSKEQLVP